MSYDNGPPENEGGPDGSPTAQPHLINESAEATTDKDDPSPGGGDPEGNGQAPQWRADPNDYPPGVDPWKWRLYACGLRPDPRGKGRGNGEVRPPPPERNGDQPPGVDYWEWRWYCFGLGPDPRPKQRVNGPVRPAGDTNAWARAVFNGEVETMSGAVKGTRNDTLNSTGFRLYRIHLAGALDKDTITDALTDAAQRAGLPDSEIRGTLRSAYNGALKEGPATDVPTEPEPDVTEGPIGEPGGEPPGDPGGEPPGEPDSDGGGEGVDWRERTIELELDKLRIRGEARRRLDAETQPAIHYPPVRSLAAMLNEPDTPTRYRIQGVAPADARIMCSAQYKAGKTTLISNLTRALVDAEPFLGRFTVNTPAHGLVLIDDEMSENTLRSWLRAQDIRNTGAVADVITLRGNVGAFNLLDAQCHAAWVKRLADVGCDYLILDCLRPVLDALGLDENHDAGRFLVAFDALLHQAGIGDALLVQHMGHTGERARGDSRMQDWPDAIWRLVREDEDPASARFFTAYGRDVDVIEGRLSFDPATRRLTYSAGSRGDARSEAAQLAVIGLLAGIAKDGGEPPSYRGLEEQLIDEHTQKAIRAGIALAVKHGFVTATTGPRRAKLHAIAYPCSRCGMPVAGQQQRHLDCPSTPEDLFT